jgi:hypothetical protein
VRMNQLASGGIQIQAWAVVAFLTMSMPLLLQLDFEQLPLSAAEGSFQRILTGLSKLSSCFPTLLPCTATTNLT